MAAARDTMGGQSGEANHGADAALRAAEQWSGGKSGQPLLASVRGRKQIDCRESEQLAAQGQFPLAMAVGEEAKAKPLLVPEVPDALETVGQSM